MSSRCSRECGLFCDFESECGWDWNGDYVVTTYANLTSIYRNREFSAPTADASDNPEGHYLYYMVNSSNLGVRSNISSPMFDANVTRNCALTFYMQMTNMVGAQLTLITRHNLDIRTTHKKISGNNNNMWEKMKWQLGALTPPFAVTLELEPPGVLLSKAAHFAIDNIRMENCLKETHRIVNCAGDLGFECGNERCLERHHVCDLTKDCPGGEDEAANCTSVPYGARCTFEDGPCGWSNKNDITKLSRWSLLLAARGRERLPPNTDHTYNNYSGHFMCGFTNRMHPEKFLPTLQSVIFNPVPYYHINSTSRFFNSCQARFHYHVGTQMLNMLVITNKSGQEQVESVWEKPSKPSERSWNRAVVTLPLCVTKRKFRLAFAVSNLLGKGCAGVDDVSLSPECFGIGVPESEPRVHPPDPTPTVPLPKPVKGRIKRYFRFSSCGKSGRTGPDQNSCDLLYNKSVNVTVPTEERRKGFQVWTVPESDTYTIIASGASGGVVLNRSLNQSHGNLVRAAFRWRAGEKIFMVVGQKGKDADPHCSDKNENGTAGVRQHLACQRGGGGGGASAIFTIDSQSGEFVPLVIAGGGGGISSESNNSNASAQGIQESTYQGNGIGRKEEGGAGAGWNDTTLKAKDVNDGISIVEGGQGGKACEKGVEGGFGGGGGGCRSGGGGGGYKGGDGGIFLSKTNGQGGTSFVSTKASNVGVTLSPLGSSDGSIIIVPQSKTECPCTDTCVLHSFQNNLFFCACSRNRRLESNGVTCHEDVIISPIPEYKLPTHHLVVIILCILVTVAVILFFFIIGFARCPVIHCLKNQEREFSHEPLSNPEVQLSRLRQTTGGMITEYNPNYEFGGSTCTLQDLREIPRENLTLVKALGQGAFGEVYQGYLLNLAGEQTELPVAVKTLPELSSPDSEKDFVTEACIMSKFNHPNIVRFIGVCFEKMPRFIVLELLPGGDLKSFLRESRPKPNKPSPLTMTDLLKLSLDVAKGCQYLEDKHFIHRDIAARNCLLTSKGPDRTVKIADFGMARDIYRADYYRKGGKAMLPVKWMPPEAFMDGMFTTKTDVWSFGVLLWEVMSMGYMPYPGRGNQEVMQLVTSGGRLEPPANCPGPVYHIMTQCWHPIPDERPNFPTVLERLGYCMQDPDVTVAPLPVFHRPPSMERDATVMRPSDSDNVCLQVYRPEHDVQSPGSEDYMIPMPSSNYSLSTERTELHSASSMDSVDKLLELEDNPPIPPRRAGGDPSSAPTWETSFSTPQPPQKTLSASQNRPKKQPQQRPDGYAPVPTQDEELPIRAPLSGSLPNYYAQNKNFNQNQIVVTQPSTKQRGSQHQATSAAAKENMERVSSLRSLDALPLAPGVVVPAASSTPTESATDVSRSYPGERKSTLSLNQQQQVVANNSSQPQGMSYANVDVNSNNRTGSSITRTSSYDQNMANQNVLTTTTGGHLDARKLAQNEHEVSC